MFDYESNASSYTIRVQAKDEINATSERVFTVNLIDLDDESPVITLIGESDLTVEAGSNYTDANASWTDNVDGSGTIAGVGEVNSSVPGVYSLTYDIRLGLEPSLYRYPHIYVDTTHRTSPKGDANVTHEAGDAYEDAGAYWNDIVDGEGNVIGLGEGIHVPGTTRLPTIT